jgi:hypothetical protein
LPITHHAPPLLIAAGAEQAYDATQTPFGVQNLLHEGLIDFSWPKVTEDTPLSQVSLLFAIFQKPRIYVVDKHHGTLLGFIDAMSFSDGHRNL